MQRRTNKQIAAARANGTRSQGPATESGKRISSRNSFKHGLNSRVAVLNNEEKQPYAQLTAEYMDCYDPQTPIERDLVNDIVSARWRLYRAISMQTASLDVEMDRQRSAVAAEFSVTDESTRCALAFHKLVADGPGFAILDRHEARLLRTVQRTMAHLDTLRQARAKNESQKFPNEPGDAQTPEDQPDAANLEVPGAA